MRNFSLETEHPISIPTNGAHVDGLLHIPQQVAGIIIFAHGSGSNRFSARNQFIARELQEARFATLLMDLLTIKEEEIDNITKQYRFDIPLLAARLSAATHWIQLNPLLHTLPIGYFGASTGGGAALLAAANEKNVKAVVSRGGRPDLAGEALSQVQAATLLIVGENDQPVIELNQQALQQLHCKRHLEVIPGATHLFEEPGKLAIVAKLAKEWFSQYLVSSSDKDPSMSL